MNGFQEAASLARLLGDPVRLMILQALIRQEASASELRTITETTQPNLSNHLKLLRDHDIVHGERRGRQIMYRIAAPAIAELVETLLLAVPSPADPPPPVGPLAIARTCYDHLAGKLGVALYEGLLAEGAIAVLKDSWSDLEIGPKAEKIFGRLGIDLDRELSCGSRRRLAYRCADWSETGQCHIGGLVGATLCRHCQQMGWITRIEGNRAVELTVAGEEALEWLLG